MIKTLRKLGTEENFLNLIKSIFEKPTGSIIPNGQRLKAFLFHGRARQRCLLLFSILLGIIASAVRRIERNERHTDRKKMK